MPDLFATQDGKHLKAKWDRLFAAFHIVSRDYKRVLAGEFDPGHCLHRTILKQYVSDLLDVEADMSLAGMKSPAEEFDLRMREAWDAAVAWVQESRPPSVPLEAMPVGDIELLLERRKQTHEHFHTVVARMPDMSPQDDEPADSPTVLVHHAT